MTRPRSRLSSRAVDRLRSSNLGRGTDNWSIQVQLRSCTQLYTCVVYAAVVNDDYIVYLVYIVYEDYILNDLIVV